MKKILALVRRLLFAIIVLLQFVALLGQSAPVAVPVFAPGESSVNLNGNSVATPFELSSPSRFQQVYGASLFEGSAPEGGFISSISFRVDAQIGHFFEATIPRIRLDISTTQLAPDQLNPEFDSNVGMNNLIVIPASAVRLSGSGGDGRTGFHVDFIFSSPYFYDPSKGNLLLDFRIYQGFGNLGGPQQGIAVLDAFDVVGDSVSSVYGWGTSMPASGQVSSLGLATAIPITPVPEPSSLAIISVGSLFAGGLAWNRRKNKRREPHVTN